MRLDIPVGSRADMVETALDASWDTTIDGFFACPVHRTTDRWLDHVKNAAAASFNRTYGPPE